VVTPPALPRAPPAVLELGSAYRVEVLPQDRRQLLGEKVPIAFADAVLICH
jgi:hypothetical protein